MKLNFVRRPVMTVGVVVALLGGAGVTAAFGASPPPPPAPGPNTLYVSSMVGNNTSCNSSGYATIQAAVNAAKPGATVYVCPGNYPEQVTISTANLKLTGAGSTSVIDPATTTPTAVSDLDGNTPITPIVDVTPGTTGVNISFLVVNGAGLGSAFSGCGDNFVGILYQAASGNITSTTVENIELSTSLGGCQDGLGIFVQAGPSGKANVPIQGNTVNGYDKGGVVCADVGAQCNVTQNTVTGLGPSMSGAANGVQISSGATGNVNQNTITGNDWTGPVNTTEPQADFASGVLVYGAGGNTQVQNNTLTDNQIAVEVVHSNASTQTNTISETGSGIANSVGVFAVPCDIYCSIFNLSGGHENDGISNNTISFPSGTSGADGVWVGDAAASSTGVVQTTVNGNTISGATNNIVFGPTAYGSVSTSAPPPGS